MEGEEAAGAAEVRGSGTDWRGVKKEELASPRAVAKAILGTASDLISKLTLFVPLLTKYIPTNGWLQITSEKFSPLLSFSYQ